MSAFLSIRNDPHFRRYFDAVHPFFWPVLYWQLKAAWLFLQREKLTSILLAVSWWGGVRIVCLGDRIQAPEHNPFALTKPRWDDPVWSSDVPFDIETRALREAIAGALVLARRAGGRGARHWRKPAGALPPMLDST